MNNCLKKSLLFVVYLALPASAYSLDLPNFEAVPGGIASVNITEQSKPGAFYRNNHVMVLGEPGNWHAIIGIPLNAKPGKHSLDVMIDNTKSRYSFSIEEKQYQEQRITIKNERQVNPLPVDMERINRERPIINKAKAAWSEKDTVPLTLDLPVIAPTSSPFGLKRFFNDQARNPHSGLDLAANLGTPILAAAPGRVVNAGDYFFNGNTVFIEHGQGMITMYCHMNSISVEDGQEVFRGEAIGTVGKTGRVTGAHLHWSVFLNNTAVNPELFVHKEDLIN